jgi:hypothetical protein
LIALGWVLSSHADASIRQPEEALRLARRAVELSETTDPRPLDVVAAALASVGRFDNATTMATTAADLAARAGATEQTDAIRARLALYRAHRPYIEPAR